MKQVEFNTKNENPFYGMTNTLDIFQSASKGITPSMSLMESAWKECKDINQKAVLMSILFSIGDITARQHNIFETKVENGGNSERETFRDAIIPFLASKVNKKNMHKLMTLITEYTVMDNILANRVVTKKKSNTVLRVIDMISVFGMANVADYCANIILNGTTFQKMCLAKFLTRPRQSKRAGHKQILPQTVQVMEQRVKLLTMISTLCALSFEDKGSYVDFNGYYAWRKEFISMNESTLFSSGGILDFDKEEFLSWLNQLSSDARFRVRNRVMFSKNEDGSFKWVKLKGWYADWEKFKDEAQTEQRVLETQIENGGATEANIAKLKEVKKKAKVTTGAVNFAGMFKEIINGTVDKVKVQPFMDKINLPYNTLVFGDDSGSMDSTWGSSYGFSPRQFAAFMTTICLMKNPDPEGRNLVGLFSRTCRMFNGVSSVNVASNSLLAPKIVKTVRRPLIDSNDHFLNNLSRVRQFYNANSQGSGTYIDSVFETIGDWAKQSPQNVEELQRYPVWTFISDGNFNNKRTVANSIMDFFKKTENLLGFRPYIIIIDVARNSSAKIENFEGIDNVMMVPPNPASIEMFLTNFRDMDTFDVYTPLLSVYRSKRYAPIREFTYSLEKKKEKELV